MPSPAVFSTVRAVIAHSFMEKIPCHIVKDDFFESASKTHSLVLQKSSDSEMFLFEGPLRDVVCVEGFLREHLMKWGTESVNAKTGKKESSCQISCTLQNTQNRKEASVITVNGISQCESSVQTESGVSQNHDSETRSSNTDYNLVIDKCVEQDSICIPDVQESVTDSTQLLTLSPTEGSTFSRENQDDPNYTKSDKISLNHENEIYMDIKLSCRPSFGLFKDSRNTPVTLVMRTEESLVEAVCLDSTNGRDSNVDHIIEPQLSSTQQSASEVEDWKKVRSRRYEEKAQFKFFCTQCSFKSKRKSHLKKHALLHERVCKLYSCDHCEFSTIRLGHLQRHVMQHSELQLSCTVCSYKTQSRTLLRRHHNLKHKVENSPAQTERPELHCVECNYSTTREKLFHRHQIVHSASRNVRKGGKSFFECDKCQFRTTTKSNLARHSNNVHDGDRPFLCNVCGQGFKRSDTLTQHLVVHASGDSSMDDLQCPHCQKFYRSKSLLHEHILIHSDARSYLCELCGAAFKTRAVQRKHVRMVHTNAKLFPCNHCSKKFNSKFAVKRHMKLHEPKVAVGEQSKSAGKSAEDCSVTLSDQWTSPVMTLPVAEDVQVLVVQQESTQQGVMLNEGAIFVQDSTQVQIESASTPSETVNVPILPVEYVLPEVMTSQICSDSSLETQFTMQDGEVITLQFVQ